MGRRRLKALIELSDNFEDADQIISQYADFKTVREKIAFLRGMFDVEIIDHKNEYSDEQVYQFLLMAVIEKKFY